MAKATELPNTFDQFAGEFIARGQALVDILELVKDANHPTRAYDEACRAEIKRICLEVLKCPLQNRS